MHRFQCDPCRIKERRRLVLPRTIFFFFTFDRRFQIFLIIHICTNADEPTYSICVLLTFPVPFCYVGDNTHYTNNGTHFNVSWNAQDRARYYNGNAINLRPSSWVCDETQSLNNLVGYVPVHFYASFINETPRTESWWYSYARWCESTVYEFWWSIQGCITVAYGVKEIP
jgi:hypothetical protein